MRSLHIFLCRHLVLWTGFSELSNQTYSQRRPFSFNTTHTMPGEGWRRVIAGEGEANNTQDFWKRHRKTWSYKFIFKNKYVHVQAHIYAYIHTQTQTDRQTDQPNNCQTYRQIQTHINGAMLCGVMCLPQELIAIHFLSKTPMRNMGNLPRIIDQGNTRTFKINIGYCYSSWLTSRTWK